MNYMTIDMNGLETRLREKFAQNYSEAFKKYEAIKKRITNCEQPGKMEELLVEFEIAVGRCKQLKNNDFEDSYKATIKAAELFNQMTKDIYKEFPGASNDVVHGSISFPWSGNSINWPVKMLADRYNLNAGMFSLDSSFTTFNVYTEDDYKLSIGIDPKENNRVLIDFGEF